MAVLNGQCLIVFIEKGKLGTLPRSVTMRVGMKLRLSLAVSCLETQVIITSLSCGGSEVNCVTFIDSRLQCSAPPLSDAGWGSSSIVLVHKGETGDPCIFRPIPLISYVGKVFLQILMVGPILQKTWATHFTPCPGVKCVTKTVKKNRG